MHLTFFILPLVLSIIILVSLGLFSLRFKDSPGATPLIIGVFLCAGWALVYAVELINYSFAMKLLMAKLRFIFLAPLSVTWFLMVKEFTTQSKWLNLKRFILLMLIPFLTYLAVITESHHNLFRYDFRIDNSGVLPLLIFHRGPWMFVHLFYSYLLLVTSCLLLLKSMIGAPHLFFYQNLMILIALLIPTVNDVFFIAGVSFVKGYNFTPSIMSVTSLFLVWALFRFKALDIIPVARSRVIDTMAELMIIFDNNNRILDLNRACEVIFGVKINEVIGKKIESAFSFSHELTDFCLKHDLKREISYKDKIYDSSITPIARNNSKISGYLLVMKDISLYKEAEESLIQAKKTAESANHAKSLFLANMSHEIRTPINGIIGMIELLLSTELNSEQKDYVLTAKRRADLLLLIINDILDFSKIEAGKLELLITPFNMNEMIDELYDLFVGEFKSKGLAFRKDVPDNIPFSFKGDPTALKQVLTNLTSNALKFTSSGEVSIKVDIKEEKEDSVFLKFSVSDTGIGIAEEKLNLIFDPFVQADAKNTRKYGGTGLGLAISRLLCEMMGGDIGVTSNEGSGSTFWFTLNLLKTDEIPVSGIKGHEKKIKKYLDTGYNILIAEDDPVSQIAIGTILEKLGFAVNIVSNGKDAAEAARIKKYDMILMDCQMPEMDGYEAAKIISSQASAFKSADAPIIALTASAMKGDRERCIEAGMKDYLTKPLRTDILIKTVDKWLNLNYNAAYLKKTDTDQNDEEPELIIENLSKDLHLERKSVLKVFKEFFAYMPSLLEKADSSLREGKLKETARCIHQLKGASGCLRLNKMFKLLSESEKLIKTGETETLNDDLKYINSYSMKLLNSFKSHMDDLNTSEQSETAAFSAEKDEKL